MDTDFVAMGPLGKVLAYLDEGWDIVAYTDESGQWSTGPCKHNKSLASNFMAGRKGNPFSATWWKNIKTKLTRMCGEGDFNAEKVCCHEAFDPKINRTCHIPWAYIEHLKKPECDHDAKQRPAGRPPNLLGSS